MGALRDWWNRRNDPPPPLPDKVTWTETISASFNPDEWVAHCNKLEGGSTDAERWKIEAVLPDDDEDLCRVRLVRFDGAYRWRDDGFRGF